MSAYTRTIYLFFDLSIGPIVEPTRVKAAESLVSVIKGQERERSSVLRENEEIS